MVREKEKEEEDVVRVKGNKKPGNRIVSSDESGSSSDGSGSSGTVTRSLKVPKCEIFDRSDFHDFYPIKSLWEGDFGVKIKCKKKKYLGAHLGPRNSLRVCSV
jgi:hypothetical protein